MYNQDLKERYTTKYPKICHTDQYFDDPESFVNYVDSQAISFTMDYPDLYVRIANEAEFPEVTDWIMKLRKDERNDNLDFIVGIEKSTHDFFTICRLECCK